MTLQVAPKNQYNSFYNYTGSKRFVRDIMHFNKMWYCGREEKEKHVYSEPEGG